MAAPLVDGLEEIAAALPSDVVTQAEQFAYRAIATTRGTTAHAVATAAALEAREIASGVTAFVVPDSDARMRVLFMHGGGLIAGNRFDGVDILTRHARDLGLEIWTAEYPLAPEASYDEMVEHLVGIARTAAAGNVPLLLAGQSAGGGLAATLALACRDHGIPVAGQLLLCPMLDDRDTISARQLADDPSWSRASNRASWSAALEPGGLQPPGMRDDLQGLAPTFLDAGSAEIFRDSIVDFAKSLWAAGVRTELHVWSGGFHASDCAVPDAVVSQEAHRARERWLRRLIDDAL